jgi:hypothetical protein
MYRLFRKAIPASGFKGVAMAFAATRVAERLVRRNPTLRRGARIVNTATWLLPLGMFAWRRLGPSQQRPEASAGG